MPHISIKCYPGRTEEQKRILADCIKKQDTRESKKFKFTEVTAWK